MAIYTNSFYALMNPRIQSGVSSGGDYTNFRTIWEEGIKDYLETNLQIIFNFTGTTGGGGSTNVNLPATIEYLSVLSLGTYNSLSDFNNNLKSGIEQGSFKISTFTPTSGVMPTIIIQPINLSESGETNYEDATKYVYDKMVTAILNSVSLNTTPIPGSVGSYTGSATLISIS